MPPFTLFQPTRRAMLQVLGGTSVTALFGSALFGTALANTGESLQHLTQVLPDLDRISATRPILIWHRSTHEFILNTPALVLLGITPEILAAFPEGVRAQSDFDQGHFFEQGGFAVMPGLAPILATPDRLAAGLAMPRDDLHRAGIPLYRRAQRRMDPGPRHLHPGLRHPPRPGGSTGGTGRDRRRHPLLRDRAVGPLWQGGARPRAGRRAGADRRCGGAMGTLPVEDPCRLIWTGSRASASGARCSRTRPLRSPRPGRPRSSCCPRRPWQSRLARRLRRIPFRPGAASPASRPAAAAARRPRCVGRTARAAG